MDKENRKMERNEVLRIGLVKPKVGKYENESVMTPLNASLNAPSRSCKRGEVEEGEIHSDVSSDDLAMIGGVPVTRRILL